MEVGQFVAGRTSAFEEIEIADGRMLNACIASILLHTVFIFLLKGCKNLFASVNTTLG